MNQNKIFLEQIKKELDSLTQDQLYDLLVKYGMKGLTKLPKGEKSEVIIIKEEL